MKPIKLKNMKRTNCWRPKGKVWYQKNEDGCKHKVIYINKIDKDIHCYECGNKLLETNGARLRREEED